MSINKCNRKLNMTGSLRCEFNEGHVGSCMAEYVKAPKRNGKVMRGIILAGDRIGHTKVTETCTEWLYQAKDTTAGVASSTKDATVKVAASTKDVTVKVASGTKDKTIKVASKVPAKLHRNKDIMGIDCEEITREQWEAELASK